MWSGYRKDYVSYVNVDIDIDGVYSMSVTDELSDDGRHQLLVFGCDCYARVETVDKAREMVALIEQWISLQATYGLADE